MSSSIQSATFILIRHGETDWNVEGKFQGHTDIPLNENGISQAISTAKKLTLDHPDITAIYSSDLLRAKGTALHSALHYNLPVETTSAFREFRGGVAEGMTRRQLDEAYLEKWESLAKRYPVKEQRWDYTPVSGQETVNEQIFRMKQELIQVAKKHPSGKIAVFSHGGILKSFVSWVQDLDRDRSFSLPNCSIIEISLQLQGDESLFQLIKLERGV